MNTKHLLCLMLLISAVPALAQGSTGLNGRHIGSYGGGRNPYNNGGGIAPGFRTTDGNQFIIRKQALPPLRSHMLYEEPHPGDGHSQNYTNWVDQTQPPVSPLTTAPPQVQIQPPAPVMPEQVTPAPVTQTTQEPFSTPAQREAAVPTYASTTQEMVDILNWTGVPSQPFDYLSWYLKGAQIDPKPILQGSDDWLETVFRHFIADDLVSTWNLTMQDTFLRLIVPFLLVMALWKGTEFAFSKIFEGEKRRV